jgi:hypothetical protein
MQLVSVCLTWAVHRFVLCYMCLPCPSPILSIESSFQSGGAKNYYVYQQAFVTVTANFPLPRSV